jgi:hypothetical protein
MGVSGYYDLRVGEFWIFHDENLKTCGQSVIDAVMPQSGGASVQTWAITCQYMAGLPNIMNFYWVDPVHYFSLTEMLIASGESTGEEEEVEEEVECEGEDCAVEEEVEEETPAEEPAAPALRQDAAAEETDAAAAEGEEEAAEEECEGEDCAAEEEEGEEETDEEPSNALGFLGWNQLFDVQFM